MYPNETLADNPNMGENQDVANEPVDYDDGIIDTGVLHEDIRKKKCDDPDCKLEHPHPEPD